MSKKAILSKARRRALMKREMQKIANGETSVYYANYSQAAAQSVLDRMATEERKAAGMMGGAYRPYVDMMGFNLSSLARRAVAAQRAAGQRGRGSRIRMLRGRAPNPAGLNLFSRGFQMKGCAGADDEAGGTDKI